ncbi:MAG TPA: MAPEG family protein [Woeseiaceae bacterium]|nr:MAPEG family protein [Woeseiaceae bacterium]
MSILYPALALFALTAVCVFRLGYVRFGAIGRGEIDPRFFESFRGHEEPEVLRVHARHVRNLFEAPLLFYAIVLIACVTQQTGWLPVLLAWGYVLLRMAHSYVHLTSNRVMLRFRLFALSWIVLLVLWLLVFIGIALR